MESDPSRGSTQPLGLAHDGKGAQGTEQQNSREWTHPAAGRTDPISPSPSPASSQPTGPPLCFQPGKKEGPLARPQGHCRGHLWTPLPQSPLSPHSHRVALSDSLLQPFLEIPKNNRTGSSFHTCLHGRSGPGWTRRCTRDQHKLGTLSGPDLLLGQHPPPPALALGHPTFT